MKAILDYLRRHKKEVGVLFSMGYIYLQSHPEYDLARELLGVLSGALIGAGAMDSDAAARYKQGITSRADD